MERTQIRLATGKKVNPTLDDAVKYFADLDQTRRAGDLAYRKSDPFPFNQILIIFFKGGSPNKEIAEVDRLVRSATDFTLSGNQWNLPDPLMR